MKDEQCTLSAGCADPLSTQPSGCCHSLYEFRDTKHQAFLLELVIVSDQQSWVQHMISVLVEPAAQTAERRCFSSIYASDAQQASSTYANSAHQDRGVCNAGLDKAGSEIWHTPLTIYHTPSTTVTMDALLTSWSQVQGSASVHPTTM